MIACDGNRCSVQGPVNLGNAVELLARGNELFTSPQVTLDLAGVTDVDSAALSLLLEWRREAARNGRSIRYENLPANLQSLAGLYGVAELIAG